MAKDSPHLGVREADCIALTSSWWLPPPPQAARASALACTRRRVAPARPYACDTIPTRARDVPVRARVRRVQARMREARVCDVCDSSYAPKNPLSLHSISCQPRTLPPRSRFVSISINKCQQRYLLSISNNFSYQQLSTASFSVNSVIYYQQRLCTWLPSPCSIALCPAAKSTGSRPGPPRGRSQ